MKDFKIFINNLVKTSSKIIHQYYQKKIAIELKADNSSVTLADKQAEEDMRLLIMKNFPEHGIIGEEFGTHQPQADYQWVLDPIDGTKSFIHGVPTFGTLVALLHQGQPILGAIHLPVQDELLLGDNENTTLNGQPVRMRECAEISRATLLTTDHLSICRYQNGDKFNQLIQKVHLYRTWGDCYGYYLLASGRADIMIDPIMNIWDVMALIPVIRGAGGKISDYQGKDPVQAQSIIAASAKLHADVIAALND